MIFSTLNIDEEIFTIALKFFQSVPNYTVLLHQLTNVKDNDYVEWCDNVLTLFRGQEVVKFHQKTLEINERLGLKDRFYIKPDNDSDEVCVKIYHRDLRDEMKPRNKSVYVLGAVRNSHDSGAALIKDGILIGAIEEERLCMNKHEVAYFPKESTNYLLNVHGLSWDDIDHIAITYDYNFFRPTPSSKEPDYYFRKTHHLPLFSTGIDYRYDTSRLQSFLKLLASDYGSEYIPPVTFVKHHKCHAEAAYHASGFIAPTLVITIDGQGEDESATVWLGLSGKLKKISAIPFVHSLGHFYHIFTVFLGYRRYDEGKVMGFAPYGAPMNEEEAKTVSQLKEIIRPLICFNRKSHRIEMDRQYFTQSSDSELPGMNLTQDFLEQLGKIIPLLPPEQKGRNLTPKNRRYAHLAYIIQERTEQVIEDFVEYYLNVYPETKGLQHVVLSGGLALNIAANGMLIKRGIVKSKNLFIPAYPADEGTAIGAALSVSAEEYNFDTHHSVKKISLGKTYSDEVIQEVLNRFGLVEGTDYEHVQTDEELIVKVVNFLMENNTVAWFQGGAELGPRALGNRSLLHRIDDPEGNLKVNRIKKREFWRPSALSIQEEKAAEFLEGISTSPFMTIGFPVIEEKKQFIKAGVHPADGTTRPQTVSRNDCPLFWSLLDEIGKRTGIPAVLNTSFNRDSPIVETPEMALNTFYYCENLSLLAIGNFIVKQKNCIVPNVLNGRDEPLLKDFFLSGNYLTQPCTVQWDIFWEAVIRLSASRTAHLQHFLIATVENRGEVLEILRVPLLKEMFQKGTRENIITDLALRIQQKIYGFPLSIVNIDTTAICFRDIIRNLFQKFAPKSVEYFIRGYLQSRQLAIQNIDQYALSIFEAEYAQDRLYDNLEWTLRSLLGKTSRSPLTNEDVLRFFRQGAIRLETILYQCILRPGHIHHSKRLKKDLPIRAVNQPYTPLLGNVVVEKMLHDLNEFFDLHGIIEKYQREGKRLMVIGKGHGGLILGLMVAEKLNLPFLPLTKNPFDFELKNRSQKIWIRAEEPHLPKDSPILFSNMIIEPDVGVIIVDDEATSGLVHRNTIKELRKHHITTELVVVLLKASDRSRKEMADLHVPFYYMTEAETRDDAPLTKPEIILFGDFQLTSNTISSYDEESIFDFSFIKYPAKTRKGFFVDHPLRGMTMPLDPIHFRAAKRLTREKFTKLVDLKKVRKKVAMRGRSLFIVGTTPSGLHSALAASMSLNLPLLSASTRPEPVGVEDVVNYIGLDGYTYSIFGLTPGDSVLLVTGELSDGEEQKRIIKSLQDNQITIEAHLAVMENTRYGGNHVLKEANIPSDALLTQDFEENIRIFNITEKAHACLLYALDNLSREIKAIHSEAVITKVKALPSSFTRGMMMSQSDMDEIFIFVDGISQDELNNIYPRFAKWIECPEIAYIDDNSNMPVLISEESRQAEILKHSVDELFLIDLLQDELIIPMNETAKESNRQISMFLYEKTIARIKLLLYLGELSKEHVIKLLEGENPANTEVKCLADFLENYQTDLPDQSALHFALELDNCYKTGKYIYKIDHLEKFIKAIEELNRAGIIRVYGTKILPIWRMHSGRVSTRFWERQIQAVLEGESQELLSKQMTVATTPKTERREQSQLYKIIRSENQTDREIALREWTLLDIPVQEENVEDILNIFDESPALVSVAACDLIMKHPEYFFHKIQQRLVNRTPMNVKTGFTYKERVAVSWLITVYMRIGKTSVNRTQKAARFVYERFMAGQEENPQFLPHLVMLNIIENLPFVMSLMNDCDLREKIQTSLLKMREGVSLRITQKINKILPT